MKSFYSILFFLTTIISNGQKIGVIHYDSDWKITTKEESAFFRTCIIDTVKLSFYGEVKDYYKDGKPQMRGTYKDNIKIDSFFFYFPNGNLESKGLYKQNLRSGIWKYFYRDGQLKQIIEFLDSDFQIKGYFDSLGNSMFVNGTGIWNNDYKVHNQFMWVRIEGDYQNWKRDGKWKVFTKYGDSEETLEHTDKFREDDLKSPWYAGTFLSSYFPDKYKFRMTEEFHYSIFVSKRDYPYIKKLPNEIDSLKLPYDTHAAFPGGEKELYKFIKKNLRYPSLAKKEGVEKVVIAEFTIDKNGMVTNIRAPLYTWDIEINKYGFQEEAIRLIQLFPQWSPAKRNNENVPQKQSLMITFSITEIKVDDNRSRRF